MRTLAFRTILMVTAAFAGMSAAYGQAGPTQTGHALDANFQVGSGGYNDVVGGVGGVNSQLYVTGQIRGLGAFAGKLPYNDVSQIGLALPSAAMSTFLRQSVGLADVYAHDLYTPTPYYDRDSTILGLRAIERGFTAADLNMPTYRSNFSRKLYSSVTSDYRQIAWAGQVQEEVGSGTYSPSYSPVNNADPFADRETMRSGDSLFGVNQFGDQRQLAREFYDLEKVENPEEINTEVNREVDATLKPTEVPESKNAEPTEAEKTASPTGELQLTPADQDIYTDLLIRLEEQARQRKEKLDNTELQPLDEEKGDDSAAADDGKPLEAIVTFDKNSGLFIRRLAGKSKDAINRKLAECEDLLKKGEYYKAVDGYQTLTRIDHSNPLVYVGLAQSQLAAGELLNAAINFRSAMRILPPIMETRVNLVGMLGEDVFKQRLATVMDRMKGNDNPSLMLAFLATYLNANSGDEEQARKMAAVLKKVAGDDKLLQAYATFELTGKRPGETDDSEQPATRQDEEK